MYYYITMPMIILWIAICDAVFIDMFYLQNLRSDRVLMRRTFENKNEISFNWVQKRNQPTCFIWLWEWIGKWYVNNLKHVRKNECEFLFPAHSVTYWNLLSVKSGNFKSESQSKHPLMKVLLSTSTKTVQMKKFSFYWDFSQFNRHFIIDCHW